jgi:peptidoglycan/xylan/chitin deacetylase (PgdA/CDA1 family)
MKNFLTKYKTAVTAVLFLAVVFIFLDFFFRLDDYYRNKMSDELTCITECGTSSGRSSYVNADISEDIVFRSGDTSGNRLAITCNVDWGEDILPDILATLDEYDVKITFFVTGNWAEKNPAMLRTMYLKGHEIQSHGYSHKLCSQVTSGEVESEMDKASDAIYKIIAVRPTIFAPPSGDFDENTVRLCKEKGYLLSLWSADTIDWRDSSTADVIYDRIMSKDLHGAIILMHPKEETAKVLPRLLDAFKEQGLTPVTLSELIEK